MQRSLRQKLNDQGFCIRRNQVRIDGFTSQNFVLCDHIIIIIERELPREKRKKYNAKAPDVNFFPSIFLSF